MVQVQVFIGELEDRHGLIHQCMEKSERPVKTQHMGLCFLQPPRKFFFSYLLQSGVFLFWLWLLRHVNG